RRPRPGARGCSAPGPRRSRDRWGRTTASGRTAVGAGEGLFLGLLAGEVLLDLGTPVLVRLGDVDLELEALDHVGGDLGLVDVELLVPAAELVDRAVLLAQQRVLHGRLVEPDVH